MEIIDAFANFIVTVVTLALCAVLIYGVMMLGGWAIQQIALRRKIRAEVAAITLPASWKNHRALEAEGRPAKLVNKRPPN